MEDKMNFQDYQS